MDREWTYRPPVLVGERVVWLGRSAGLVIGECCEYGPHHGIVSWIGRVPEMGNHWTVGVEFDVDMPGGCDGAWNGRQLFSCPRSRGLFLPVSSLIKEKDFYSNEHTPIPGISSEQARTAAPLSPITSLSSDKSWAPFDLSLAPEPPPPKMRIPAPTIDIHTRNCITQTGAEVDPSVSSGAISGVMARSKMPEHFTHDETVNYVSVLTSSMSSSPSTGATTSTVYSSAAYSTSTSKKDLLAERLVQSGAQDTSQECKNVSNKEKMKMNASRSVRKAGLSGLGRGDDEDWHDAMSYFGETMVRKSTLPSCLKSNETFERLGQSRQPSVSTPSSPTLNDYQRQYGKKLSSSSTSTTASDVSKYMSSPGRYSMGDRPYPLKREKTSGFLNIFRWFRNRDKKRSTSVDRMSNASEGSMNSLSSTASGFAYFPITRSKSADTQKKITSSKNQTQFGITRRYKLFSRDSSLGRTNSNDSNEDRGRRLSAVSASSDTSSKPDSRGTTLSRKKRPAPQPPGSPKPSESGSLKSQKSFTSLPSREPRPIITSEPSSPSTSSQATESRKLQKSKSEGLIYTKVKRRAPLPPGQTTVQPNTGNEDKDNCSTLTRDGQKKRQAPSVPLEKSGRPLSTVSTGSSLSQSPSSASTTLKSQNSSANSSGATSSQYSAESIRLESGFLRQDIAKSSSSPAIPDTSKLTLSPRPWYKRKKNKDKENSKDSKESGKREKIYDSWMPDIQFSRNKLGISGSFRKSKSSVKGDEDTLKKSKDDEKKEKRKSQVSLLANISELDRAASEQMQRELEQRKARKETYDSKFYKTNEPHILTQRDFLPRTRNKSGSENSDINTLSSSGTATLRSLCSVRTEVGERAFPSQENGIYDNLNDSGQDSTLLQSYSKQATLRIDEKEGNFSHSCEINQSTSDASLFSLLNSSLEMNSVKSIKVSMNPSETSYSSRTEDTPESNLSQVRESPMRRAAIDAELFYQLAKDSQISAEPKNRNSPVLTGTRDTRKMPPYEEVSEKEVEDVSAVVNDSLVQFRRPSKNFGLRMNNFFSPDVSTIIEASESMTSSATTPADDIYDDLPISSSVNGREKADSIHDELNSEANYEFRLNSTDTREIMQELADVRQEIEKINEEEEEETRSREKKRSDKIREEVLQLRERDNFEVWQNAIGQAGSTNIDAGPPPPIELNEGSERKLKWVCEMCTLINLPWRLQCEACMIRRPANPKRVDEDGKSFTSDHISSQLSVSDDSPVTVIHDDSNVESSREAIVGAEAISPDNNDQPLENEKKSPSNKKKRDINWERELQKYFKTFDEHVKGISDTTDSSGQNSETKNSTSINVSENEEQYGKIKKSSQNEVGITISKGAKPKKKIFGTAAGPPDTFIKNSDTALVNQSDSELKTLEFTITESHSNEGLNKEPDMEQIRKARLAKFQGDGHVESGHLEHNDEFSSEVNNEKNSKNKRGAKKRKESGVKSRKTKSEIQESNRNGSESNDSGSYTRETDLRRPRVTESQPFEDNETFYKKKTHKPQVLKPSGAVRNVVSIFNQFEQLQHAKKEKPMMTRRKSSGNVIGRKQIFEQLNSETNSPELPRDSSRSKPRIEIQRDKEVFSAVAKFDEMAAMAEIERIEKQRVKNESVRRKPRLFSGSSAVSSETSENSDMITAATTSHAASTVSSATAFSQSFHENVNDSDVLHGKPPFDPKLGCQSNEISEGIIKGGVLYTEQRKRSMSIGSGTFELIQAKDFETIEAQHTESSPSPETRNITSPVTSSAGPVASIVVPQIVIEPQDDQILPPSHSDNPTLLASEVRVEHEGRVQVEKKEVERLSRQLTDVDGIATFKATLRVEEPALGQTNTLNINRLLKRLEGAISHGNHALASQLAQELAELRVSCSVTRSPKNEVNEGVITTFSKYSATPPTLPDEQIAAMDTNLDLRGTQTPTSNMSECFYDASEMFDNEEMSISENSHLLEFADMDNVEQTIQVESPDTKVTLSDSLNATVTSDSGFLSPASLQVSASVIVQNNTRTASATEELNIDIEGQEAITKNTSSPTANRRDTRVDPARREVKSDTISKLPDGPSLYMKDHNETVPPFNVKMYVEDKNSHQGPITFTVSTSMTVGELRKKVCRDFGFPPEVQRWILGRRLADDDSHTLEHHKVTTEGCPIFLYLVAPEPEPQAQAQSLSKTITARGNGSEISNSYSKHRSPRYLQVYDSEGNVEYRFYNPDTKRYEISVDIDDSDNDEDDSTEDEDTLEEDDENMYQNAAISKTENQENRHLAYISETSQKADKQENKKDNLVQSEESKYTLPQPLNAYHEFSSAINVSSQANTLNSTQCKEVTSQTHSSSTITSHIIHDERMLQKNCQWDHRLLQPQSVEKHTSDSTQSLSQQQQILDKKYTNQQQKLYREITPDSQQDQKLQEEKHLQLQQQNKYQQQHLTSQQQQQSTIQQLSITPKPQESNLSRDISKEHSQNLHLEQNSVHQPQVSKLTETSVNEDCQMQSQSRRYTPKHQTPLTVSSHAQSIPAPTQLQSPQSKHKLQQQPSESLQSSQHHQQSRQTSQPLQQHSPQPAHHQSSQSSQHQSSQPVHQSSLSPKQSNQSKQQSKQSQQNQSSQLQQQSRQPHMQSPQLQRHAENKDPANHQLSEEQEETAELSSSTKVHGWVCPRCTLVNKWARPGCEACATERPGTVHPQAVGTSDKTPGIGAVMSELERQGCVPNPDPFECCVCFMDINVGKGVVLRDCLHTFCRDCLANAVKYSDTADVKCPYRDNQYSCDSSLQDREIKALVTPKEYDKHLSKSVKQAEGTMQNVFHCKTPDCPGFCQFEDNVNSFHCDVCKKISCLTCQAQHEGTTCKEYQDDLAHKVDEAAMKTKKFFDDMIRRGDGLPCPKCSVMLMRKWGCDWMRCPMCRTEICWVTRGPRWGPGGPGDVSGGCKCGIRGQKCHPKCTYCH